jgi:selenide, water dikinase
MTPAASHCEYAELGSGGRWARPAPSRATVPGVTRRVVLVGGGHAHVLVLERWRKRAPGGVELTVVSDRATAIYSGMIPGVIAGQYEPSDVEIDVGGVAEQAGARFVVGTATRVDAAKRRVHIETPQSDVRGLDAFPYDVASIDVGSTVSGLTVPGVVAHAVPTRPIHVLVDRLRHGRPDYDPRRVVVVGAGAAGVELALALDETDAAREDMSPDDRPSNRRRSITLVDRASSVLAGHRRSVSRRVERILKRRGVVLRLGTGVSAVASDRVTLDDGSSIDADLTVWAVGASAHPFLRSSGLPVDEQGFVNVDATLQVRGAPELFAAGDCASFPRPLPKAGVYAVRQADVLCDNIIAQLEGRPVRWYRPQSDYMTLLNLGDGTAMGTKWGLSVEGRSMWWLKDRIDRRFMRRFQE